MPYRLCKFLSPVAVWLAVCVVVGLAGRDPGHWIPHGGRCELHFSSDGRRLALVGYSWWRDQWQPKEPPKEACTWLGLFNLSPPQFLYAYALDSFISLSPDGKRLAVWHGNVVRLLDAEQHRELPILKSIGWCNMAASNAAIVSDWSRVVLVTDDSKLFLWSIPKPLDLGEKK